MGDARGGTTRARNILQHGLEWMKDASFQEGLHSNRSQHMLQRLLKMAGGVNGDCGYSLGE